MKWNRNWLVKQKNGKFDFEETITFPKEMFYNLSRINDLKDVEVTGSGNFNSSEERLYVTYHVQGTMVVPCAISLEDVDYPFSIDTDVVFAFYKPEDDEDVVEARKDVANLTSVIFQEIMMAIPMRVVKEGAKMKTSGSGWKVMDESEVVAKEEDTIDPRLAKLKDYFNHLEEYQVQEETREELMTNYQLLQLLNVQNVVNSN